MSKRCIFLSLILGLKIFPQALRPFNPAFIHNNAVRRVVEDKVMSGAKRSESGGGGGGYKFHCDPLLMNGPVKSHGY